VSPFAIEAEDLSRAFGAFRAVDRVSFGIERGEIFGFLGANGAGKSTTIRMLTGLLAPTSGTARIGGHDVSRERDTVKGLIGYMSQKFSLYLDLPAWENVLFFGRAYGLSVRDVETRAEELFAATGLSGLEASTTAALPGGTRQRLALACALLHRPEVVFLDEPTAGVDPVARRYFWQLIRSLSREGTTVFVTTHYLDEAEDCGRIGLMADGRLVALDTPAALKRTYVPERVLIARGQLPSSAAEILKVLPGVVAVEAFGAVLHLRVDPARWEAPSIQASLGPGALVEEGEPSLEDVFLAVTGR
jgi:ABC-2 type transport system ATP-binding protein